MKNIANMNTIIAEAMDEIKGVWEREEREYAEYVEEYWAWREEEERLGDIVMETREWLFDHIAEYDTEEYIDVCGYYSDLYKDWSGCRPHGFWKYLREAYEEYWLGAYQGA